MKNVMYKELIKYFGMTYKNGIIVNSYSGLWQGTRTANDSGQNYIVKSLPYHLGDKFNLEIKEIFDMNFELIQNLDKNINIKYIFQKRNSYVNNIKAENSYIHMIDLQDNCGKVSLNYYSKNKIVDKHDLILKINKLKIIADKISQSEFVDLKYSSIIFDKEASGLIMAMIIGYFFEGDRVASNTSYFFNNIEKFSMNIPLSVYDELKPNLPVYFEYDQEGIQANRKVCLIKNGKINSYLTDKYFAKKLGTENNGRSRSQDYRTIPFPRITNVIVKKGNISFSQLVSNTECGIYCVGISGVAIDVASGVIHINCLIGYQVRNRKLIDDVILKGPSFSFEIFDFLKKIKYICDKYEIGYRIMGKGRPIQNTLVGFSSPEICLAVE